MRDERKKIDVAQKKNIYSREAIVYGHMSNVVAIEQKYQSRVKSYCLEREKILRRFITF